jgi:hypothetical protein
MAQGSSKWPARRTCEQQQRDRTISMPDLTQEELQRLTKENERLRRDNERFVRLIDSGEWGRGRVAELVAAGEVLKSEKDALLKLIQVCCYALRRQVQARISRSDKTR